MRITDCRYDRDRLRLAVAYRLIAHEARTQTIRQCTGLSGDRIRKLYRDYIQGLPGQRIRRRRGKSPRQMSFFRKSVEHELQAATLGCLLLLLRACSAGRSACRARRSRRSRGSATCTRPSCASAPPP